MKKCPFCAESIQDEAVVCRWCGRSLSSSHRPSQVGGWSRSRSLLALGGALMAVGPFISWVSLPIVGSLNLFSLFAASDGAEGAAWVPVVLGAVVAISAASSDVGGLSRTLAGICGLLVGLLAVPLAVGLADEVGRSGGLADLGLGSWATAGGAVIMFIGAVTRSRPAPMPHRGSHPIPASRTGVDEPSPQSVQQGSSPVTASEEQGIDQQTTRQSRLPRKSVLVTIVVLLFALTGLGLWQLSREQDEPTVDMSASGWVTLASTSDDETTGQVQAPLVYTDQVRVCWDILGDLEKFEVSIFGNVVSEGFETSTAGNDCRYFSPDISHADSTDCATVAAYHEGDVKWKLVVQQEKGEAYGLSGINTTYQYGLLDNPCTGEPFDVPSGFVDCDDGTYAKSESDCTWAERLFDPYEPAGYPEWTCYPDTRECVNDNGSFVPEGPVDAGSYCDPSGCFFDS